jgi:hypothetical protein
MMKLTTTKQNLNRRRVMRDGKINNAPARPGSHAPNRGAHIVHTPFGTRVTHSGNGPVAQTQTSGRWKQHLNSGGRRSARRTSQLGLRGGAPRFRSRSRRRMGRRY